MLGWFSPILMILYTKRITVMLKLNCKMEDVIDEHRDSMRFPDKVAENFWKTCFSMFHLQHGLQMHFKEYGNTKLFNMTRKAHFLCHIAINSKHINLLIISFENPVKISLFTCSFWCILHMEITGVLMSRDSLSQRGYGRHSVWGNSIPKLILGRSKPSFQPSIPNIHLTSQHNRLSWCALELESSRGVFRLFDQTKQEIDNSAFN